ncbi:lactase-phlorizin hydrolase-like [Archocentrus centrarchus]|uniref:lactase-phlorizin hydrolase-like n=1 Tax=Archocentrus centrarchus TaxID=63155 RepID=UPI0011E9DEF7|nr:lactase-phlorizin hydrolase-like [Archocentrus centrarchus]
MMKLLWVVCLYISCLCGCQSSELNGREDFMLLAGPLTNQVVRSSDRGMNDAFDCSHSIPPGSKQYFEYLQSRGVTHFKVPLSWAQLLPTGHPSQPQQAVVRCYQTLLKQLLEVGLQPLVILHGWKVPEPLQSRYGGWESQELAEMFQQYAEFAFQEFAPLARSWLTLSDLDDGWHDEQPADAPSFLQNILQLNKNIYQLYHRRFPDKGRRLSLGLRAKDEASLSLIKASTSMDFLSVQIDYNCAISSKFQNELRNLQKLSGNLPILIYKMTTHDCSFNDYQLLGDFLNVLMNNGLNIVGCDMKDMLEKLDMEDAPISREISHHTGMAGLRNNYQTVWDKFGAQTIRERDFFLEESFPSDFQWATSSVSFKVEGGWSEGGKGKTIWDRFGHEGLVSDNQTADLACDSYHKVDYDVYLLRGLQVNTYQFSISWARIFPSGYRQIHSEKGAQYYDQLINALIESGIQPIVTLYHWDLPQALQDFGGWTNASIVEAFKAYADFCFSRFGDRVKIWNTFSSPWVVSHAGYGTGKHAPGVKDYVESSYQVTHNILKSHAEAWHAYNDNYRKTQGGKVGIALNSDWAEPKDPAKPEDIAAAERYLQFMLGWFAHPIFVDGDYPATLKAQIEQKKTECPDSVPAKLPVFTPTESQRIRGTADFFGLNHYTSRLVSNSKGGCTPGPQGVGDFDATVDLSWQSTASDWIYSAPWGLRRLLNYISTEYLNVNKLPIYITGNGMPTNYSIDSLTDTSRMDYMRSYINEALKATITDGVDVQRFTVQSLMDGFEGKQGYSQRFGLHYVNFEDQARPRTPKQSAYLYSQIIEQNGFGTQKSKKVKAAEMKLTQRSAALPPSEVPSKSKVVWEKFSSQSQFHRQMYHYGTFPQGFSWGVSSSAYQIEGGWNADGKGPSIWDTFTQTPGNIPDNANGNVACDSYNRLNEDLYMLRALRVKSYRFSLSWSRIFPGGTRSFLNQKGVDYYNRLIDGLVAYNITPMVTLYHWDLPQALQKLSGWENVDMIEIFNDFCDFCFATFGDRVKFWMTFNQPQTIAWSGYGLGNMPPNVKDPGYAPYRVAHNLIKAHAKAYHTYDDKYRKSQGGLISIALDSNWFEPVDVNVVREVVAADRAMQFQLGWFAHPIFKNGDYPEALKWQVGNKSEIQGLSESRLPSFTEAEKSFIKGTADVFCINHYTTSVVSHFTGALQPHSYEWDRDLRETEHTDSPTTAIPNQKAVAWGLRRLLNWIKEEYGDPEIYVTENGAAVEWDDFERVMFYKTYIDEALKAYELDGVRVQGYTATSFMDSFEWLHGYRFLFGMHHVDFTNPDRPRTPKYSAHFYYNVIKDNGFPMPDDEKMLYGHFREDFMWSTASSAYQIEGGWRADGKGLSIWDKFAHSPSRILNDDVGDIACDSYNKIEEDVAILKQLKVSHYRFSISWPRVLPDGTINHINEAGINYYQKLLDALLAANIQPQVTLYHWDLPQAIEDYGGFLNDSFVKLFRDYADLMFDRLGSKVKIWITFNEPIMVANHGYGFGGFAPGISSGPDTLPYIVGHNLIKAHAEAWHVYNDKYRAKQNGKISITLNSDWSEPRNPYRQEDYDAARRVVEFYLGWFAHPIFNGDYSEIVKTRIRDRSLAAGLPHSRLPEFTPEEIKRVKGTHDFFGLNHYTSVLAFPVDYGDDASFDADKGVITVSDRVWLDTGSVWLKVAPFGLRKLLNFIKEQYGNPPIIITENGVSEKGIVDLNDVHRNYYYEKYINQVLKAYLLDGVDVRGYTAWSLMDNLEWAAGFSERFGFFYVNRSDPNLPRVPKNSVNFYTKVIKCNGFPDPESGHECLNTESGATTTTPSVAPSAKVNSVNFLSLELSSDDAETGLYTIFALLIVAVFGAIGASICFFTAKKKFKKREHEETIRLE